MQSYALSGPSHLTSAAALTPSSTTSSTNTFLMPNSPVKGRQNIDGYRPKVTRTLGQRPACLVNATVTYCGNNVIYAFGGFDAYTDEVYNHVLKLDMVSHQWSLGMLIIERSMSSTHSPTFPTLQPQESSTNLSILSGQLW